MTDFRPMSSVEWRQHLIRTDTEAGFQTRVIEFAQRAGWLINHNPDSRKSQRGLPDLVLVHPRRHLFAMRELKRQDGRIRKEQKEWLVSCKAAGIDAEVWRPDQWFDGTIQDYLSGVDRTTLPSFAERTN